MSGSWRLDLSGTRTVLDATASAAPHASGYDDALHAAAAALSGAPEVAAAVSAFARSRADLPERLEHRITAVIGAAAAVTEAIVVGDEEMGADITAAQLRDSSSVLTEHGLERR